MPPWVSTVVRVVMGLIMLVAGSRKVMDIPHTIDEVASYRLVPDALEPLVGTLLPFAELTLAAFLLVGLCTRLAGVAWLVMMSGFTVGLIWAWTQGFSLGAAGEPTNFPVKLATLVIFAALGAYLVARPLSRFSLDGRRRAA